MRDSAPLRIVVLAALVMLGALLVAASPAQPQQREAVSIELTGTIDPATGGWVDDALEDAAEEDRPLAILRVDTPGGLDSSMRQIVRAILDAPLPVIVHVAPNGARAASAGVFITMAADVAAMAPQTNIGSATPVNLGGGETTEVLGRKIRNDAAAYVRALAETHGRNADLAERMVRDAVNVTAGTALERGLVDVVAADEQALLGELDGFEIRGPKAATLDTAGLVVAQRDMPLQYEIQQVLVNPTVAYLLLIGGLLGIVLELLSPGLGGPGVLGAVAFVLGLYGSAQLPVTVAGVILIVLAVGLLIAETQVPSFGVLGVAGVAALVAGGLLLYDTDSEVFEISVPIAAATGVALGSFTLFAAAKALAVRAEPAHGGVEDLVGAHGTVRVALDPVGQVYVAGALWRARSSQPLPRGERVRVDDVDGLTLTVHPDPKESP